MLRGGAYKPRTSPYDFQGLEVEGLKLLAEAREKTGLKIVTEVVTTEDTDIVAEYADIIQGVFGLDNRPQAAPHYRRLPSAPGIKAHAATISHDPNEVGRLYDFPPGDGSGQCVGIIELGGGFRVGGGPRFGCESFLVVLGGGLRLRGGSGGDFSRCGIWTRRRR